MKHYNYSRKGTQKDKSIYQDIKNKVHQKIKALIDSQSTRSILFKGRKKKITLPFLILDINSINFRPIKRGGNNVPSIQINIQMTDEIRKYLDNII